MFLLLLSFLLIQLLLSIPNRGTAIYLCVCVALLHHLSFAITHKKGSYLFEVSQVNRRHLPLFHIYLYSTAFSQFFLIGFFLSLCCSE